MKSMPMSTTGNKLQNYQGLTKFQQGSKNQTHVINK